MKSNSKNPTLEEIEEAKRTSGGWVYRIAGKFSDDERIPPEAIVGAWKVDNRGQIIGDFIDNENYDAQRWPSLPGAGSGAGSDL